MGSINPMTILSAARENNVDTIEAVVRDHGIPPDFANKIGQTALHIAALHGNIEAARKLLDLGCPVDIQNEMQQTPLHFAAGAHNNVYAICELLVSAGADTGISDFRGVLPYEKSNDPEVRKLLDGPDPRLFEAAAKGDVATLRSLFEEDADTDPAPFNETQMATTHIASKNGHLEALEFLLEKGAFVDQQDLVQGDSILHHAVRKGDVAIIQMLLKRGAFINTQNFHPSQYSHGNWMSGGATLGPLHQTALALAIDLGELEVAEFLLNSGAAVDTVDFDGRRPLHSALEVQDSDAIELLLNFKADPNTPCKDFGTPVHLATSQGSSAVLQMLLDAGAEVNVVSDEQLWTPLMLAARSGKTAIVKKLLNAGAKVDAVNVQANTALHLAAANGKIDVVKLLLETEGGKAVVGLKNKEGKTAVDLAKGDAVVEALASAL